MIRTKLFRLLGTLLVGVLALTLMGLPMLALAAHPASGVSPPELLAEVTPLVVVASPLASDFYTYTDHSPKAGHGDGGERSASASASYAAGNVGCTGTLSLNENLLRI